MDVLCAFYGYSLVCARVAEVLDWFWPPASPILLLLLRLAKWLYRPERVAAYAYELEDPCFEGIVASFTLCDRFPLLF